MNNKASLGSLTNMPFLIRGGKNNQPLVKTTNPTVSSREAIGPNVQRRTNVIFFTATSAAVQTPCNRKNQVTSPVGISWVT
ncbi:hypothetical protein HID58_046252 [Brassica napus]|uniref:Uncharacterized protein n=1 Tax=Brassica napus TaxID=3708 RepID=A0ABQ8AW05_BRANA|nr:hypothetical protein HID58_046252 [Brassica napus]